MQADEDVTGPVVDVVGPDVDVIFGNGVTENGEKDDVVTGTTVYVGSENTVTMVDGVHLVCVLGKSGKVLMNEEEVVTIEVGSAGVGTTILESAV